MDRSRLEAAVDEWVDNGIITPEQGDELLAHAEETGQFESRWAIHSEYGRLVTVLSLLGGVLIGAGTLLYLTANWAEIPRTVRASLLLVFPSCAYFAAVLVRRRGRPRVGHGLFALGAGFVGVSLFALADLYALAVDASLLFVIWTLIAVSTGHALGSRSITALGLSVGAATLWSATVHEPLLVVGLYGVVLFAVGQSNRSEALQRSYELVGVLFALGAATLLAGPGPAERAPEIDLVVAAVALGAVGLSLRTAIGSRTAPLRVPSVVWTLIATVVLAVLYSVGTLEPTAITMAVFVHLLALGFSLATVVVGYWQGRTAIVNVAIVGFLVVVVSFLVSTVIDALSGAAALIVAGFVLLVVGALLERGRADLLARMEARKNK